MSIRERVRPEVLAAAERLTSLIEDGTIRKRTMPDTSCRFNEERALDNADALNKSGVFDKIMRDAYKGH